jgi:SAM-dependent methyltransferase
MSGKSDESIQDHATEFMDQSEALAIEDTIWWTVGRRAILAAFLTRAASERPSLDRIVEIGCGSGGDLPLLARYGRVWGIERSAVLAGRARARNVAQAVYSGFETLELDKSIGVDLYCMFDVLEHIEDDEGFVRALSDRPRSDHLLLLSVPACQFLYGPHDEILHHYRRYSKRGLVRLLERQGYEVISAGYFMSFLFPLAVLSRLWEGLKNRLGQKESKVNLGQAPAPINGLLIKILQFEAFLSRYVRFPVGLWVMVLVRRRAST